MHIWSKLSEVIRNPFLTLTIMQLIYFPTVVSCNTSRPWHSKLFTPLWIRSDSQTDFRLMTFGTEPKTTIEVLECTHTTQCFERGGNAHENIRWWLVKFDTFLRRNIWMKRSLAIGANKSVTFIVCRDGKCTYKYERRRWSVAIYIYIYTTLFAI